MVLDARSNERRVKDKYEFGKRMLKFRGKDSIELEMFWNGWNLALENVMLILKINGDKPS